MKKPKLPKKSPAKKAPYITVRLSVKREIVEFFEDLEESTGILPRAMIEEILSTWVNASSPDRNK